MAGEHEHFQIIIQMRGGRKGGKEQRGKSCLNNSHL